jgi:NADH:ubiquinone oxidoreductase subunit K
LLSGGIDFGLNRIVTCQDIAPFPPAAYTTNAAQDFPYLSGFKLFSSRALDQICETWGVPAARADFAEPVHSDIPTLLLHGQYDPSLTPEYDTQIAATLPNSYHYVVPNAGHLVVQVSPCAQQIVTAFVRDPSREPATGCLDEALAPAWVLPDAIYATPAMVNLVRATMEPVNPLTLALVAISLLIFVAALFGAVRVKTQPPVIRGLLALVALLSLAILLTLIGVILTTLSNGTLIGFGIPGGVALIRFLPLVAGGVAIALAVMVILFRRRASGSVRNLVFTSVVALAGLVVNGWLLTLGFLP